MIYVAVCALLSTIVAILSGAGLQRSLIRQQARERGLLIDQMMHLSGRTWTPPPAADPVPEPELVYDETEQLVPWE